MATNIEVKAKLQNREQVEKRAIAMADGPCTILVQEDTFFPSEKGRLKLRKEGPAEGQLIFYERPDAKESKASEYSLFHVDEPDCLVAILSQALGRRGQLNKERTLYMKGRTRIHLDRVEGLGDYMELEVVLDDETTQERGHAIAQAILDDLGIEPRDLVEGAYMDLLEAERSRAQSGKNSENELTDPRENEACP